MIQEDKQILLVDLCARLPYNCKVTIAEGGIDGLQWNNVPLNSYLLYQIEEEDGWKYIKPYLRPMSSMTEDEAKELLFGRLVSKYGESCAYIKNFIKLNEVSFRKEPPYKGSIAIWFSFENKIHDTPQIREYSKCEYLGQINDITLVEIDWLNAHHFDYRGLIQKGLALEAPEGMY